MQLVLWWIVRLRSLQEKLRKWKVFWMLQQIDSLWICLPTSQKEEISSSQILYLRKLKIKIRNLIGNMMLGKVTTTITFFNKISNKTVTDNVLQVVTDSIISLNSSLISTRIKAIQLKYLPKTWRKLETFSMMKPSKDQDTIM